MSYEHFTYPTLKCFNKDNDKVISAQQRPVVPSFWYKVLIRPPSRCMKKIKSLHQFNNYYYIYYPGSVIETFAARTAFWTSALHSSLFPVISKISLLFRPVQSLSMFMHAVFWSSMPSLALHHSPVNVFRQCTFDSTDTSSK